MLRTTITTNTHTLLVKLCERQLKSFLRGPIVRFFMCIYIFVSCVCFFLGFIDAQLLCKQAAGHSATRRNAGGGGQAGRAEQRAVLAVLALAHCTLYWYHPRHTERRELRVATTVRPTFLVR